MDGDFYLANMLRVAKSMEALFEDKAVGGIVVLIGLGLMARWLILLPASRLMILDLVIRGDSLLMINFNSKFYL